MSKREGVYVEAGRYTIEGRVRDGKMDLTALITDEMSSIRRIDGNARWQKDSLSKDH